MKKWLYFKSVFVMILIAFSVLKANEIPHETIVENPKKEITTVESQKLKENAKIEISVNKKNVIEIPWREDKKNIVFTLPEEVKEGEEILFLDSLEELNSSPSKETKKFNRFKRTTNSNSLPTKKIEYKVEGKNNVQAAKESAKSKSVLVKRDALTGKISGVYSRKGRNSYIHQLGSIELEYDDRLYEIFSKNFNIPESVVSRTTCFLIYDLINNTFVNMVYVPYAVTSQNFSLQEYSIPASLINSYVKVKFKSMATVIGKFVPKSGQHVVMLVDNDKGNNNIGLEVITKTPHVRSVRLITDYSSGYIFGVEHFLGGGHQQQIIGKYVALPINKKEIIDKISFASINVVVNEILVENSTDEELGSQTYTYVIRHSFIKTPSSYSEKNSLDWRVENEIIFNPQDGLEKSELGSILGGTSKLKKADGKIGFKALLGFDGKLLANKIECTNTTFQSSTVSGLKYICDKFTFEITSKGEYKFIRKTSDAFAGSFVLKLFDGTLEVGEVEFGISASGPPEIAVNSKIKVDKRIFNNRVSNELFLNTNGSMAKSLSDLNNMQFSPYNYKSLIETTGNPIAGSISFKNIEDNGWKTIGTPNIFGVYGTASTHIGKNSIALKLNEQNTQDYLKENIYWGLNDITNSSIDLSSIKLESKDSAYKLGVALSVDSMESSIGTGKINLSKAKMNEVNIFSKDGIGEVVSDKNPNLKLNITGKMPQTSSYGGANIVNKLRITGTKNAEVSGTSYENENYKLMLNAAGNFEITKKSDNAYQDTLKIEYIYEDVVLGEFTLEIENYNFKLQIVGDDFIDLGSMLKGETQKIDGKLKVKLDSGSSGYTKIVKAEVDKTFMHELKNEASGETLLYKVNTSTNQTGDEVPVNISIEMTPNNNLAVGKYSGFLNLIITIE